MKKFSVLLAILALVLVSLACQTVMGGGDNGFNVPDVPDAPVTIDGSDITVGGESPFPVTSDAFNVVSASEMVTYQTKLSADDLMKFYRDELGTQGFSEDTTLTTNFGGIIAMIFNGDGKTIIVGGAPAGDGSLLVTVTYQQ